MCWEEIVLDLGELVEVHEYGLRWLYCSPSGESTDPDNARRCERGICG